MTSEFLQGLFGSGEAPIGETWPLEPDRLDRSRCEELLSARARVVAETLPDPGPKFDLEVATWAARLFHASSYALVHRELEMSELESVLATPCPREPGEDGAAFGADLVLSFAPDLVIAARAVAEADPLVECLLGVLRAWPLSTVGIQGAEPVQRQKPFDFWEEPALRMLFLDRISTRSDSRAWAAGPEVEEALKGAGAGT